MQRKNWWMYVGVLMTLTCTFVFARTPGSYSLGGFGGLNLPQGPDEFKDYFKSGIGFGAEFKYNINEKMSFVGSFAYLPFNYNEDKMEEDIMELVGGEEDIQINIEGGGIKYNAIQANLLLYLSQPEASTGFYLTGGGGYYMGKSETPDKVELTYAGETIDITDMMEGEEESENDLGVNFGAGLELAMGTSMSLFVEGKYHIVFTEDESTKFITLMGGLRFSLQ